MKPQDYKNKVCQRFVRDMLNAGLGEDLRHYRGRFHWEGPAVSVRDLQDALSHTRVKCQWDQLGLGYIVYPIQAEKRWS